MSDDGRLDLSSAVPAAPHAPPLSEPTRNPIDRSGSTFRVEFFSTKCNRLIKCESLLESRVLRCVEFARDITAYSQQPPKLRICVSGRWRPYTPDFQARWRNGETWLVEVKPLEIASDPQYQERIEAATRAALPEGRRFVVMTERQVKRNAMADIDRLLELRWRRRVLMLGGEDYELPRTQDALDAEPHCARLAAIFEEGECPTVSEAIELLGGGNEGRRSLDELLSSRAVCWSVHEPLTPTTRIHKFTEVDDEQLFA